MTQQEREPMDDEMESLLSAARWIDAPPSAKDSVRARLALSLPTPGGGGGGGDGGGGESAGAGPGAGGFRLPVWSFVASLFVSGAAGFAFALVVRPSPSPTERVVYVEKESRPLEVATMRPSTTGVSIDELRREAPPPALPTSVASTSLGADLAKERAVLDVARAALGRGDAPSAIAATSEHERKYPRGALREEREAIAIQALVLSGQKSEAAARAGRFQKQFPQSLLLPTVEAAVGIGP